MIKKKSVCKFCIIASVLLLYTTCHNVLGQDGSASSKRLGIGIEIFSTTGFGIEAATPVHPKLTVRAGFSFLPFKFEPLLLKVPLDNIMESDLNAAMSNTQVRAALQNAGLPTSVSAINTDIDMNTALGLKNVKILVDFHPLDNSAFHITAGFYIGAKNLIKVEGEMQEAAKTMDVLNTIRNNGGPNLLSKTLLEGYDLTVNDLLQPIDANLTINAIKPYIGIGFGRAVPKRLAGVKFEIGTFIQGAPKITSSNKEIQKLIDTELAGMGEVLKIFKIYPVLSLKINFGIL